MNASNSLLPLFKEQLEAECASLGRLHDLKDRGHHLIYWYFLRLHEFTPADVAAIFCDGGNDLGIDAIWTDDDELVHFYQFKHPQDASKNFPGGDVDKTISGLRLILNKKHGAIANAELKARLDEVYQQVPKGYRIHFVSSGAGIVSESKIKLDSLLDELRGPSKSIVQWDEQPLQQLQETFYQQSLPAVKEPIRFAMTASPYMVRSGAADCYLFHVAGALHINPRLHINLPGLHINPFRGVKLPASQPQTARDGPRPRIPLDLLAIPERKLRNG